MASELRPWLEPARGACLDPATADLSGLDYARSLLDGTFPAAPIARLTGRRIVAVEEGRATFAMPATDWFLGPKGRVLNGALVFLAHAPSWVAVLSALPRRTLCIVAELSMTFLAPPPVGGSEFTAEGELIYLDEHNGLSEVFVRDGAGGLVAHSTSRSFVFPPAGEPLGKQRPDAAPEPTGDPMPDPYLRPATGSPLPPDVFDSSSGLEILRAQLDGDVPEPPIHHLTGLRLTEASSGRAAFALPTTPWLRSEAGTVFGGVIGLLANSAAAAAVQTVAPRGTTFTALDVKVNFLHQVAADGKDLVARGTVVHTGRRLVIATADVVQADGRRVAMATGTTMLD